MRWLKRGLFQAGIIFTGTILFLILATWTPVSLAHAQDVSSGTAIPSTVTVQTTPAEDATVTALNKDQLTQQVATQQHTWDNWFWDNAATVLSSALSTFVIVIGALFGLWRWRRDRRDAQGKELKDREREREQRAEERFQAAVSGLGNEREEVRVGAAILLRTFLRPGHEEFYVQTFDLAIAHLRLSRTSKLPEDPSAPLPLTTLSQALIVIFKEAFPLARSQIQGSLQALDATGIFLDNAYLTRADLKQARMRHASLRNTNFYRATLSGARLFQSNLSGANLKETDLSGADLGETNIEDARSLEKADLRGVTGLTREQLATCKAKGAIIEEDSATNASQSTVAPASPPQSNDTQASSAPSAQESTPPPDPDGSDTNSSQQESES